MSTHFAAKRFSLALASKSRKPLSRNSLALCLMSRFSSTATASAGVGIFVAISFLRRFVAASTHCAARAADSPVMGGALRRVQHQTDHS